MTRSKYMFPSAASLLFLSGNISTPGAADDPVAMNFNRSDGFQDFVDSKNFRGALALDDVEMVVNEKGRPTKICFRAMEAVGYTPIRVKAGRLFHLHHDLGRGSSDVEATADDESVTIKVYLRFKIGRLGELVGFFFTHQWAPSAYMVLQYRIDCHGTTSVVHWGSGIPSQAVYRAWRQQAVHDMMGNSLQTIDGFLNAGACRDAPEGCAFDL